MTKTIIAAIDSQIAKLHESRALLAGASATPAVSDAPRRGRSKGSKNAGKAAPTTAPGAIRGS